MKKTLTAVFFICFTISTKRSQLIFPGGEFMLRYSIGDLKRSALYGIGWLVNCWFKWLWFVDGIRLVWTGSAVTDSLETSASALLCCWIEAAAHNDISIHSSRYLNDPLCAAIAKTNCEASLRPKLSAPEVGMTAPLRNCVTWCNVETPSVGSLLSLASDSGGNDITTSIAVWSTSLQRLTLLAAGGFTQFCLRRENMRERPVLTPISISASVPVLDISMSGLFEPSPAVVTLSSVSWRKRKKYWPHSMYISKVQNAWEKYMWNYIICTCFCLDLSGSWYFEQIA